MKQYWLMKCEATECTFDALYSRPDGIGRWRGVRNYEARNNIRAMKRGDGVLFYQSACADPGVSGIAEVRGAPYPDPTAIDPSSPYFDALQVKIRTDGTVANQAVYLALAVNLDDEKELLGLWISPRPKGPNSGWACSMS